MSWGEEIDRLESIAAIHEMIHQGVNFIDTGLSYGMGASEQIIGEAIKGSRHKVYLATKGGTFHRGRHVVKDGIIEEIDKIAASHNVPVSQVAINWNIKKPYVDTSIIGVRKPQEAKENCMAMGWTLTEEEMAEIDNAIDKM
jgi:aryl-alcohol dehydrogenase-like predicted oxidoreductase